MSYYYDVDDPSYYGSNNNRLMYEELRDSMTQNVLSRTWYYYTLGGNVSRVVTREESVSPPMEFMMSGGETELELEGSTPAPAVDEDGGEVLAAGGGGGGGGGPCDGMKTYTGTRFGYARNGQTMTFVHDESWCWDGVNYCEVPGSYQITWAREFRYDGARARYMNRPLDGS